MKKIIALLILSTAISCSSNKSNNNTNASTFATNLQSTCPKDGFCKVELIKNKTLNIKEDTIGALYYQLEDSNDFSIIKYQYIRKVEKGLQDAEYKEEVIFEIANTTSELNLTNNELKSAKMLFGRHCFCKGQAGYFKINEGELHVKNTNNLIQFELDFIMTDVPQTTKSISTFIK